MNIVTEILYRTQMCSMDENRGNKRVFMFPYYSLIRDKLSAIVSNVCIPIQKNEIIEQLVYQVVSYAYDNYFKFVYPYEYKLAKENGLLRGSTSEEQNNYFIFYISAKREWIEYFFEKYPKLHSMLQAYSIGIMAHIKEMFASLSKDYEYLNSHFCCENSIVNAIHIFEGDLHGGRCVSSIIFRNGIKLYYKPRGCANERFLLAFVSCLSKMGLKINIGIPLFLDKDNYSWHLHINSKDINDDKVIKEYYYNLGNLQSLFYLLGTQDIIPDNIICVGSRPYIIDCESIISKPFKHLDSSKLSMYLQESVLQTGILPDWMFNDANERTQVSSVLFEFDTANNHLPWFKGKPYPITEETLQHFKWGFMDACDLFRRCKVDIAEFFSSYNVMSLSSRILLHPTIIYSFILKEMVTPSYLHGDKMIKELIEPIIRNESYGELRDSLIKSIITQIESGNIPYFYIKACKSSLYILPDEVIVENWVPSEMDGLSPILKRLSLLTEKKQLEQLCIIDETINFFIDVTEGKSRPERITPSGSKQLNRGNIMHAVERVDMEIRKRMIEIDDEIGFVCRTKNSYDGKFQVCLMNNSLYDGILGVCLFYRSLYEYSHNPMHLEIGDKLFAQLRNNWRKSYIGIEDSAIPISPLSGITGVLYLMERFPGYYDFPVYASIISEVKRLIPITTQYDYMSGVAGLIQFIVQCKRIDEIERLSILEMCGNRIMQLAITANGKTFWTYTDGNTYVGKRKMVLGGFAHGSSSISWSLFMLAKHLNDKKYLKLFNQVLLHDRSFYSEKVKGWLDGRNPFSNQDSGSWCHGATGIALSRLALASEGYEDATIEREVSIAVGQIEKRIGYNLSVCHGSMGNLEVLQAVLKWKGVDGENCLRWFNSIVNEIISGKDIVCGDDNRNSQVGLFMGFAGIGYQLLRFYDWKSLPSILCLEITPSIVSLHKE